MSKSVFFIADERRRRRSRSRTRRSRSPRDRKRRRSRDHSKRSRSRNRHGGPPEIPDGVGDGQSFDGYGEVRVKEEKVDDRYDQAQQAPKVFAGSNGEEMPEFNANYAPPPPPPE